MTTIQPHIGPGVTKMGFVDPDNITRQILESEPDLEMGLVVKRLVDQALGDTGEYVPSDLLTSMLWAEGIRSYWRVKDMMTKVVRKPKDLNRDKKKAEKKARHILLSVVRRMTGAQCTAAASRSASFALLAQKVKPNERVGDVLTDAEIVKILK